MKRAHLHRTGAGQIDGKRERGMGIFFRTMKRALFINIIHFNNHYLKIEDWKIHGFQPRNREYVTYDI